MIPDEPVRGGYLYLEQPWLFSTTGLEQVRYFLDQDDFLRPPLYHMTGLSPSGGSPGSAAFSMPSSPWWQSAAAGVFLGGTYPFVADAALGMAVYTGLPAGKALATSELSVNFLRPATLASGLLTARASVIQTGRSQGLSEARVEDGAGQLLAHATSRLVVRELPFEPPPAPDTLPATERRPYGTPDPFERPPDGEVTPQEVWDRTPGLEMMQRWLKGDLPMPPVAHLTGWRPLEIEEGRTTWAMPASEWFATSWRTFYGGAVVLLVDGTLNAAFTTTLPPATCYGTLDLKVHFLRPVEPDGRDLVARATVIHRGRTVAVATCEVENADGKRVATAVSSCMYLPGRRWNTAHGTIDEPEAAEL
ncbi:MAG TPA: PaaI family thioesterase [Actinomycetota bacterium]